MPFTPPATRYFQAPPRVHGRNGSAGSFKWQLGMSVIELMVTVTVLAIIASVALPNLREMIERRQATAPIEEIYNLLQFARSEAIKQSTNVRVSVNASGSWLVGLSHGTTQCTTDTACQINVGGTNVTKTVKATDFTGVTMTSTRTNFTFDARGLLTTLDPSQATDIVVTSTSGWTATIRVTRIGRVSICTPSGSMNPKGYPACA